MKKYAKIIINVIPKNQQKIKYYHHSKKLIKIQFAIYLDN